MKALTAALLLALALSASAEPLWVAVGEQGLRLSSRDGTEWKAAIGVFAESENLNAVVYGAGKFVATRCGGEEREWSIAVSPDGLTWKDHTIDGSPPDRLVFGKSTFIAIRGLEMRRSEDGEHYSTAATDGPEAAEICTSFASGDTEAGFRSVALGVPRFVEREQAAWRAVTSTGEKWDVIQRGTPDGWVAYGAGQFVVLNHTGRIETSHDAQTWVSGKELTGGFFDDLLWTGERFLAHGKRTWSSADGFEWQQETDVPDGKILWIRASIGAFRQLPDGTVLFGRNAKSWQPTSLPRTPRINAIAYRDQ
jgi:hypothetical protein